jgi:hypothetical protein
MDTSINTHGGAQIGGNVDTGGGDFIGRDQIKVIITSPYEEEKPKIVSPLELLGGIRFVHLPDAYLHKDRDTHTLYYLGESLLSLADWERIMENRPTDEDAHKVAKVDITIKQIEDFCERANEKLKNEASLAQWRTKKIQIPPYDLLKEIMKQERHTLPKRTQKPQFLRKTELTAAGFYDLLGVFYHLCIVSHGDYRAIGGEYQTPVDDFSHDEVPHAPPIRGNDYKELYWGFRPLLELKWSPSSV